MLLLVFVAFLHLAPVQGLRGYCSGKGGNIEVTMRPPSEMIVTIGQTVSVACAGHGHGMADPTVHWEKGWGKSTTHLGPVATGKSVLFFEKITADNLGRYRCVLNDCCSTRTEEIDIDIKIEDNTCQDVYGVGTVLYGAVWQYKNWTEAVQSCQSKGLEIAFPRSKEENANMLADIKASFHTHPNSRQFSHDNWVWVGASDAAKEGTWVETTSGENVTWFNWMPSQPDNWTKGKQHLHGQDCIGMNRKTGKWDDSFIHHQRPYVCKCREN